MPEKYALIVGINDYGGDGSSNLRGCLNDAWRTALLLEARGWPHENIRLITDRGATRIGILSRLDWLVRDRQAGDELVFFFSGHGTQVRDRDGDELTDHMDEALCTYGIMDDWDGGLIRDDDLQFALATRAPSAPLTIILDCCHSGSATRNAPYQGTYKKARFLPPPMHVQWRAHGRQRDLRQRWLGWARPETIAQAGGGRPELATPTVDSKAALEGIVEVPALGHLLIAGCRDNQTSADALLEGDYVGAMSHYWRKAIAEARPEVTAAEVHARVIELVRAASFEQVPQLEGPRARLDGPALGALAAAK